MEEPSVLDYVKSRLFFWRKERVQIPLEGTGLAADGTGQGEIRAQGLEPDKPGGEAPGEHPSPRRLFPPHVLGTLVRLFVVISLGLGAQRSLEAPGRSALAGLILYLVALAWLVWGILQGEWSLAKPEGETKRSAPLTYRPFGLWLFILAMIPAFLSFGSGQFSRINLTFWLFTLIAFLYAFWLPDPDKPGLWQRFQETWRQFTTRGIRFSPWTLLVLGVFSLSAFYRFYLLDQVPAEMFSDHAEKLLDVGDVLAGQTWVYFPRNTGREAFQMYLTAAMSLIFNTGLSFLSLKLGTAFCGLFTLPFIYLLGKEVASRRVGLLAMFFAGIAYWPNVISRVALRFTLYPTFTAPVLYFLVRGLRRRNRNDLILSGIFLGIGLHGYSPYRFVPFVVVAAVLLYLLHTRSRDQRKEAFWGLLLLALASLVIFLPLLRYAIANPDVFGYRMMTRMGQAERSFPGPPLQIFFNNLWQSLLMPVWDDGQIWVHSIPYRPGLGVVAAAFFVFGVLLLTVRYLRERNWLDLFWLVSIPLLMMPSVLSLAFPEENPSLNRTSGALVVIFLVVGFAFDAMLRTLRSRRLHPGGAWLSWIVATLLLTWSASQNYNLIFNQYAQQFRTNAWNTSELGAVIRQFSDSVGEYDSAWVVPYPHWVDTRLVGIRAGYPERDYALWRENILDTVADPRPKLYLVKPEDTETTELLRSLYPTGVLRLFDSNVEGRDFYIYSVPPLEQD